MYTNAAAPKLNEFLAKFHENLGYP